MKRQKRVVAIHDISGFGRCSLTVALPIISAAGIETSVIPTAVLSTHTGGIKGYTYLDLTDEIMPFAKHWKTLDLKFDGIYTGYVGSIHQLEILCDVFDMLKSEETLIVVDPVMADHGKLYKTFSEDFPMEMKKLASKADIIVPNMTEAVFMLGRPYEEGPYTESYIEDLLKDLSQLAKKVVLTGVYYDVHQLGAASYDVEKNQVHHAFEERIEGHYHGTGDVFGSALVAALIRGLGLERAARIAVDYTVASIKRTWLAGTDDRFGVNFEEGIGSFVEQLNK